MRDIIAHYKLGHLVHATAATHRGVPMLIGKDVTSAEQSEYDMERLKRLASTRAAQAREKAAEAEVERRESAAAPAAAPAPSTTASEGSSKVTRPSPTRTLTPPQPYPS